MGLFTQLIDGMKPAIKWAMKNGGGSSSGANSRSVDIPDSMWKMKELPSDEQTKKMARAISSLLIKSDLAGDDNIFDFISKGLPIKGRIIRSYVASMAMKKGEDSIKKVFIQMLLDFRITDSAQAHVERIIKVMGDDPATIRERMEEAAAETFVSLEDSDFENLVNKFI